MDGPGRRPSPACRVERTGRAIDNPLLPRFMRHLCGVQKILVRHLRQPVSSASIAEGQSGALWNSSRTTSRLRRSWRPRSGSTSRAFSSRRRMGRGRATGTARGAATGARTPVISRLEHRRLTGGRPSSRQSAGSPSRGAVDLRDSLGSRRPRRLRTPSTTRPIGGWSASVVAAQMATAAAHRTLARWPSTAAPGCRPPALAVTPPRDPVHAARDAER